MTSLFPIPSSLSARGGGVLVLALGLVGCTPPPNDLGDTGAGSTTTTAESSDSTEGEETSPGPGNETNPVDTDTDAEPGGSTTTPADTEGDTDDDTEGEEPPPSVFECVLEEPCVTAYFGCTSHTGCEELPLPTWGEGPTCVLELARDIRSTPGASVELNLDRGGSPDSSSVELTYMFFGDGTVIAQRILHDEEFPNDILFPPEQCVLQDAAYFQGCLDAPSFDCGEPANWVTDCVELTELECPSP